MTYKQHVINLLLKTRIGAVWINRLMALLTKCWNISEINIANRISPDLAVLNGPFAGLKYPCIGQIPLSKILPKLLGTYECEIFPVLESIQNTRYGTIVNIGCAEGYYAIGLAKMFPDAQIFAYDLNAQSIEFAKAMADLNRVDEQVVFNGLFTSESCKTLSLKNPVLVVCDCEGAEYELITPFVWEGLVCDFLVEIHNCRADQGQSLQLVKAFSETHDANWILGQINKSQYVSKHTGFTKGEKFRLLDEGRPAIMDWVWIHRK